MLLKQFTKGLLVGSVIGSVSGLMLAPRSGKDTKKKLTKDLDEASQLTMDLTQSLNKFYFSVNQLKETSEMILPEVIEDLEATFNTFRFQTEPRVKQIVTQTEIISQQVHELEQPL